MDFVYLSLTVYTGLTIHHDPFHTLNAISLIVLLVLVLLLPQREFPHWPKGPWR